MVDRWTAARRAAAGARVAAGVVVLAAVAATATGGVLLTRYRPPNEWAAATVDGVTMAGPTRAWEQAHRWAVVVLLVAGVVLLALAVVRAVVAPGGRSVGAAAVALVGTGAAVVARATVRLVAWDQLALRGVTVGTDVKGWWAGTDGSSVRFVLVDGVEWSPSSYRWLVVAHLGAPVLAALAATAVALLASRGTAASDRTAAAPGEPPPAL